MNRIQPLRLGELISDMIITPRLSHMYQSVQKYEVCHQTIVGQMIKNIIFKFTVLQMHIQAVLIKHD